MSPHILKIAATDHTVLLTGRTGSGKSHLARKIHEASPRKAGKFVAVNLATLSENLIESELFGHEKGAFSGADTRRIGKMESANGGTVFLDEIGELPPRLQTKLLEALNSLTVCPVGSNREISLNVRIITATNRDLAKMVKEGLFREDLFFRVNTFEVHLPGLAGDEARILSLAEGFARAAAAAQGRAFQGFAEGCRQALLRYGWPGNVRELKNAMEFAIAMGTDAPLGCECLPALVRAGNTDSTIPSESAGYPANYREAKSHFEKSYLREMLRRNGGLINLTAKRSGLSKVTLIDKIRRYDIDVPTIKYQSHLAARATL